MKVKLYVNWDLEEILTEPQAKRTLQIWKEDENNFEDYKGDYLEDTIDEYLDSKRKTKTFSSVLNLTEEERAEIMDKLRKEYKERVEYDFNSDYEEIIIEI